MHSSLKRFMGPVPLGTSFGGRPAHGTGGIVCRGPGAERYFSTVSRGPRTRGSRRMLAGAAGRTGLIARAESSRGITLCGGTFRAGGSAWPGPADGPGSHADPDGYPPLGRPDRPCGEQVQILEIFDRGAAGDCLAARRQLFSFFDGPVPSPQLAPTHALGGIRCTRDTFTRSG